MKARIVLGHLGSRREPEAGIERAARRELERAARAELLESARRHVIALEHLGRVGRGELSVEVRADQGLVLTFRPGAGRALALDGDALRLAATASAAASELLGRLGWRKGGATVTVGP